MKINLNDSIRVKLTDSGKKLFQNIYGYLRAEDDEGYTSFQMWDFINTFGRYITIGTYNQPCETDIYLTED